MSKKYYLKSAGQMWKLYLFCVIFPLVGMALAYVVINGAAGESAKASVFLVVSGLVLSIVGLVLGLLTVKCPKCHTRLLWKAVTERDHQDWNLMVDKCPACKNGYGD